MTDKKLPPLEFPPRAPMPPRWTEPPFKYSDAPLGPEPVSTVTHPRTGRTQRSFLKGGFAGAFVTAFFGAVGVVGVEWVRTHNDAEKARLETRLEALQAKDGGR